MIWTSTSFLADQAAAGAHQQQHIEADHDGLIAALQKLLTAMTTLARTSPLMGESLASHASRNADTLARAQHCKLRQSGESSRGRRDNYS